jgi:hypothetical protein
LRARSSRIRPSVIFIFRNFAKSVKNAVSVPRTNVVFYREADGTVPFLQWFDGLPAKAQDKCRVRIRRLSELGHELRRPEADLLRDGIYELRVSLQHVNYRILYFFHGRVAAIIAHGLAKEARVSDTAINSAVARKGRYEQDPKLHTFEEQ